jgi:hypothetical protein
MLFWYCIDDTLASHFELAALGSIPLWVVIVAGLIPASITAPLHVKR